MGLGLTGLGFNVSPIGEGAVGRSLAPVLQASFGALKLKPLLLGQTKGTTGSNPPQSGG